MSAAELHARNAHLLEHMQCDPIVKQVVITMDTEEEAAALAGYLLAARHLFLEARDRPRNEVTETLAKAEMEDLYFMFPTAVDRDEARRAIEQVRQAYESFPVVKPRGE